MSMTPQQRTAAALKAAATRRANRAAGIGPQPRSRNAWTPRAAAQPRAASAPIFAPKPTAQAAALDALAAFETALITKITESGITPALEAGYQKYTKCKALALAPGTPVHEANTALRMAAIEAIKLIF
jgi:hypothetical protein